LAIVIGILLLFVLAPLAALIGAPTSGEGSHAGFFEAYPWLSSSHSNANISSTYWVSFAVGAAGLAALIAGILLIILVITKNHFVSDR
jgi:hypothetical protein